MSAYRHRPAMPLLLTGMEGSGKRYLARKLAAKLLGLSSIEQLAKHPNVLQIEKQPNKQAITIDQVRSIIKFLKLRVAGKSAVRRVVLIVDAHYMNEEAQNALLKVLEEPPTDTIFTLTASSPSVMLPTMASRCQMVEVTPIALDAAKKFYGDRFSSGEITTAWRLSGGLPGLIHSLLTSDDHPLKAAVSTVKNLLAQPKYERHLELEKNVKNREELALLLEALELVLGALHASALAKDKITLAKKLLQDRKLILKLKKRLAANCSLKLLTDELSLRLAS